MIQPTLIKARREGRVITICKLVRVSGVSTGPVWALALPYKGRRLPEVVSIPLSALVHFENVLGGVAVRLEQPGKPAQGWFVRWPKPAEEIGRAWQGEFWLRLCDLEPLSRPPSWAYLPEQSQRFYAGVLRTPMLTQELQEQVLRLFERPAPPLRITAAWGAELDRQDANPGTQPPAPQTLFSWAGVPLR